MALQQGPPDPTAPIPKDAWCASERVEVRRSMQRTSLAVAGVAAGAAAALAAV